jgi:hypothetical protein
MLSVFILLTLFAGITPSLTASTSGSPVTVTKCEPDEGASHVVGFSPGYTPSATGPYFWRDPWGYRYHQYEHPHTSPTGPILNVDFVNTTASPLKVVEFALVARGSVVAEVRDVGTFSPGAEIKHSFDLNPDVFPVEGSPECVPLRATHQNGKVWTNPHLPKRPANAS